MARRHPPPQCENTQVLREAITEDDDGDETGPLCGPIVTFSEQDVYFCHYWTGQFKGDYVIFDS